jgi:hypothetical protein
MGPAGEGAKVLDRCLVIICVSRSLNSRFSLSPPLPFSLSPLLPVSPSPGRLLAPTRHLTAASSTPGATSRSTASAIYRRRCIKFSNCSGNNDCAPSHNAFSGSL